MPLSRKTSASAAGKSAGKGRRSAGRGDKLRQAAKLGAVSESMRQDWSKLFNDIRTIIPSKSLDK
jgi:hypothetical protein